MNLFYILLFGFVTTTALANEKSVTVSFYDYPPISYRSNTDIEGIGYCLESTKEAFKSAGYKVIFKFMSPVKAVRSAEENEVDAVCTLNKASSDKFGLVQAKLPNVETKIALWARADSKLVYKNTSSLKNSKLIHIAGFDFSSADRKFQNYSEKNRHILLPQFAPIPKAIKHILKGTADVVAIDEPHMNYYLKQAKQIGNLKVVGYLKKSISGKFSIGKKNPRLKELMNVYNTQLKKQIETGRYKEILNKYL